MSPTVIPLAGNDYDTETVVVPIQEEKVDETTQGNDVVEIVCPNCGESFYAIREPLCSLDYRCLECDSVIRVIG